MAKFVFSPYSILLSGFPDNKKLISSSYTCFSDTAQYLMYTQYFGLKEKPFAIAPDPRYLYMSKLHREAFAHLLYGVSNDGCLILLTGDVGTGKTTVSRCLIEQLPEKTDIAIILNPELTISELLKTICEELSISVPPNSSSDKTYIDSLNNYLLDSHAKGRSTALLIDEAQNLDIKVLEQLRLLTNLETNTHKLLQIVLLGHPELRSMLSSPEFTQINQRITSRYHLKPLKPDDVKKYIQHRVIIAGGSDISLFTPGSVKYIIKFSKGIPRLINILCDRALLGAYAENSNRVNLKIIKKAAREISAGTNPPVFSLKQLALALLLLGLFLSTGFYFLNRNTLLPLSPQPETKQGEKVESLETQEIVQPSPQRIIIINPVHYGTDLKEEMKSFKQLPHEKTGPGNSKNSDGIQTAEIE